MSNIDLFELCKAALIEKGFAFHELPPKSMLHGRWRMKGCIARYNPRSDKTMVVYFQGNHQLILYAVKKKLFISPIEIPITNHLVKNSIKHIYFNGTEYNWR